MNETEMKARIAELETENTELKAKVTRIVNAHHAVLQNAGDALTAAIQAAAKISFAGQLTPGLRGATISCGPAFGVLTALEAWGDDEGETVMRVTVTDIFGEEATHELNLGDALEVIAQ